MSGRTARDRGLWVQCACTLLVALGAAYASYRHGLAFALRFGADSTTATIWPLIVDGLLTTATVELWRPGRDGGRWRAWLAFMFGVALSLCANIASAPELTVFAVAVAVCPPLALLLAVELLNRALKGHRAEAAHSETGSDESETGIKTATVSTIAAETASRAVETGSETRKPSRLAVVRTTPGRRGQTAEQRMWAYYHAQLARGRTPSGAELDRFAATNNYGRRVLRRWRAGGHLPNGA